jgi:hypothetical protein
MSQNPHSFLPPRSQFSAFSAASPAAPETLRGTQPPPRDGLHPPGGDYRLSGSSLCSGSAEGAPTDPTIPMPPLARARTPPGRNQGGPQATPGLGNSVPGRAPGTRSMVAEELVQRGKTVPPATHLSMRETARSLASTWPSWTGTAPHPFLQIPHIYLLLFLCILK